MLYCNYTSFETLIQNTSARSYQGRDTNVTRHQHERVKTSSRTCRGKFNSIFKEKQGFTF